MLVSGKILTRLDTRNKPHCSGYQIFILLNNNHFYPHHLVFDSILCFGVQLAFKNGQFFVLVDLVSVSGPLIVNHILNSSNLT